MKEGLLKFLAWTPQSPLILGTWATWLAQKHKLKRGIPHSFLSQCLSQIFSRIWEGDRSLDQRNMCRYCRDMQLVHES